jgi:hypothetical protein
MDTLLLHFTMTSLTNAFSCQQTGLSGSSVYLKWELLSLSLAILLSTLCRMQSTLNT